MTNLGKYKYKPDENTLGRYPTILDILESLADYEAELNGIRKYPLSENRQWLYRIKEPGHYFAVQSLEDPNVMVLFPTGPCAFSLYRGESKDYKECKPSILRTADEKTLLLSRLQTEELECILRNHPIIGELINRPIVIEKFGVHFWLKVQFEGLAQHYGIATPFLDMTNNKWVAAFFAITNYKDGMYHLVEPSKDQAYGCLYRWEQPNYREKGLDVPQPLGMQYFNRPGCQSAFALDMKRLGDLNNRAEVERIYFRHDKEANQLVYDLCQQGRAFFPEDGMEELVGKLKGVKSFSEEAVERCRIKHYGDKTFEEMREMMTMSGMDIIDKPAVGFEKEQIEKELEDWNREGRERYLTELTTTMVGKEEGGGVIEGLMLAMRDGVLEVHAK